MRQHSDDNDDYSNAAPRPTRELPRDEFSSTLRDLTNHPECLNVTRTLTLTDFYGNTELWHMELLRVNGKTTALVNISGAQRSLRLVLPSKVMDALLSGQASTVTKVARRAGRKAVETKRAKGLPIGNIAALQKARKAKRK
jgi:hypothetical protein